MDLSFGLLGPVRVAVGGEEVPLTAATPRTLLGALLTRANTVVSTDQLVDLVWGESPPASGIGPLHNHIVRLRRLLGHEAGARLRTVAPGYILDVGESEFDVLRVEGLVHQGTEAYRERAWARVYQTLDEALGLWRGRPLEDLPDAALFRLETRRLDEIRLRAAELLIDSGLRLGRHRDLLPRVRELADENPVHEGFHRQLMLALAGASRTADALAVFQRLRADMVEELGLEPSTETREIHRRILTGDPTLLPVDVPADGQPTPVAQLPMALADFVGRVDEAKELERHLARGRDDADGVAVAAVSGIGGIGKTTLALRIAHRLTEAYPDGQLFVDLHGSSARPDDPGDVLAGFLRDLGVEEQRMPAGVEARAARFRTLTSGRRFLVVLDNARDSAQVRPLLPGSGRCGVLVTSRRRMGGLPAAVHVHLDSLSDDEARDLLGRVIGRERIASDPEAVGRVLASCSGLPLAVRISAARLNGRGSWSVGTLADRLGREHRRLDELAYDDVAVRATFHASYANLAAGPGRRLEPARMFQLLGLFPIPEIDVHAAAVLAGVAEEAADECLELLVDECLLDSPAPGRYRMHDLLYTFATEVADRLDERDATVAWERLVEWYLLTARAADRLIRPQGRPIAREPSLPTPPPLDLTTRQQGLDWINGEIPTLTAIVRRACVAGPYEAGAMLSGQVTRYLSRVARWEEAVVCGEYGLRATDAAGLAAAGALQRIVLSRAYVSVGRHAEAAERLTQAAAIRRDLGDRQGELACLTNLSVVLRGLRRYDEARETALRTLAAARELSSPRDQDFALSCLGLLRQDAGDYRGAIEYHLQCLALTEELGDFDGQGATLLNLGECHLSLREFDESLVYLRRSVPFAEAARDLPTVATSLTRIGQVLLEQGHREDAHEALTRALTLWPDINEEEAENVRALLNGSPVGEFRLVHPY